MQQCILLMDIYLCSNSVKGSVEVLKGKSWEVLPSGWVEGNEIGKGTQGATVLAIDFFLGEEPHKTCVLVLMSLNGGVMLTLAWHVGSFGICSETW